MDKTAPTIARGSLDRYHHSKLTSPERQIRLLSILPSSAGRETEYSLETHILHDRKIPHYYAVSYEWGAEQPGHDIVIDGKPLRIRSNLKECLQRFGGSDKQFERPLWIDAICIDQEDISEKNVQVKIMGEIFSAAKLVLVWLGMQDGPGGSLTEAASTLQDWQRSQDYRELTVKSGHGSSPHHHPHPRLLSLAEPYGQMWNCLKLLTERSYWRRLWVIQELVKAQDLLLMWGDEEMQWSVLATAFSTLHHTSGDTAISASRWTLWSNVEGSIAYQIWLQKQDQVHSRTLLENMEKYQSSNCTKAQDKAYALTGISNDASLLQVDYDKSLPDVFADLVDLVVDKRDTLRISHLVLRALRNDTEDAFTDRNAISSLRGRSATLSGRLVGHVLAARRIDPLAKVAMFESEILEMMLNAEAVADTEIINRAVEWARQYCHAVHRRYPTDWTPISFFWLSTGQIGASKAILVTGESIYACPGIVDGQIEILIRAEKEEDLRTPPTTASSPTLASPTNSTYFSDAGMSAACRVWIALPNNTPSDTPSVEAVEPVLHSLRIPLPELIALDESLGVILDWSSSPPTTPPVASRRASAQARQPHRRDTRLTDPISDIIDQVIATSPRGIAKSSTWPTHPSSHVFVDAVARDLRDKLFTSDRTELNSPD